MYSISISDVKGSVRVLFWECKFQNKAQRVHTFNTVRTYMVYVPIKTPLIETVFTFTHILFDCIFWEGIYYVDI